MLSPFFSHGFPLCSKAQELHKMAFWENLRQLVNLQAIVSHTRMCLQMD